MSYMYHTDQANDAGTNIAWKTKKCSSGTVQWQAKPGTWYTVTMYLKMNTPGAVIT